MEKTFCKFCGKEHGVFQAFRRGKKVNIRKWVCDSVECSLHNPYDQAKDYDRHRLYACRIMRKYPERINILKECSCNGKKKRRHHPDYNKPFDVELLCQDCHWKAHEKANPGFNGVNKYGAIDGNRAMRKPQKGKLLRYGKRPW